LLELEACSSKQTACDLKAQYFYNIKTDRQLLRQKVCQRISVMKTINGVFVVFKTKHELKCQFSGNTSPLLRFFDELFDVVKILCYKNNNKRYYYLFYEALLKLNDSDLWLQKGVLGAFTFKYNDGSATKCPPS
jgi:hypothetical protein